MMATTTPGAIRDVIIARIAGLTPPAPLTPRYVAHRADNAIDLRTWAVAQPAAGLRRFDVETMGDTSDAEVTTGISEQVRETFEIAVAYQANNRFTDGRGLDDVIARDLAYLTKHAGTLGFSATPTSNATIVSGTHRRERIGGVVLGVIPLSIVYWRDVS